MQHRSPARVLIGLSALLAGAGCSTFRPKQQAVKIDTDPPGLVVHVDDKPVGTSPVTVELDRNQSHKIEARSGGNVYVRELEPRLSAAGKLDIVGASIVLVPAIGLITPGAYDLDSDDVVLDLRRPATAPASRPDAGEID